MRHENSKYAPDEILWPFLLFCHHIRHWSIKDPWQELKYCSMVIVERRKTKPQKKVVDINEHGAYRARPAIMDKIGEIAQILKLGAKTFPRNREQLPHPAVHFYLKLLLNL